MQSNTTETVRDVQAIIAAARDRMQSAHRDLNNGELADAIYCVMRAVNHVALAVDVLAESCNGR
jgi:uncharacterized protein (UPF0332 family)